MGKQWCRPLVGQVQSLRCKWNSMERDYSNQSVYDLASSKIIDPDKRMGFAYSLWTQNWGSLIPEVQEINSVFYKHIASVHLFLAKSDYVEVLHHVQASHWTLPAYSMFSVWHLSTRDYSPQDIRHAAAETDLNKTIQCWKTGKTKLGRPWKVRHCIPLHCCGCLLLPSQVLHVPKS